METFWRNIKQGSRILKKKPGATLVMVLSIAFGIGCSTAIFSIVQGILLNPLPYHKPSELVQIYESNPSQGMDEFSASPLNYLDWKRQNQVFSNMAAFSAASLTVTGNGDPERVKGAEIRAELLPLLGISPIMGRSFNSQDMEPGKDQAVIMTYGFWTRRFAKDPQIVGKSIRIDGAQRIVIGVLPRGFGFPSEKVELYVPFVFDERSLSNRGAKWLGVIARLKTGVSQAQAQKNMDLVAKNLEAAYPEKNKGWGVRLEDLQQSVVGTVQKPVWILFGAVLFVLIIACTNVAGLLLAGNSNRREEMAVRAALGAKRQHLIFQLLTESILIGLLGGLIGILIAVWSRDFLLFWAEKFLPRVNEIAISLPVLGFAVLLSLASGIFFGLLPALLLSRPATAIRSHSRGFTQGGPRQIFVVAEVALAMVLLSGAGLLIRSLHTLMEVSPGFDTKNVYHFTIQNPETRYPERSQVGVFHDGLLQKLKTIPGVSDAAAASLLPLTGEDWSFSFQIRGKELPEQDQPSTEYRVVSSDFFHLMKIPIRSGRFFTDADRSGSQIVAIINETFARIHFPNENPLGKEIQIGDTVEEFREIVGVVADVKDFGVRSEYVPVVYVALSQRPLRYMNYVIRTTERFETITPAIRQTVKSMDREMPIFDLGTMDSLLSGSMSRQKFITYLLAFFSVAAVGLALFGLYGLLSYSVSQRTKEIGVRMAMGAESWHVLRLILNSGFRLLLAGLLIGIAAAIGLTRVLSSLLFRITPTDPFTFAVVVISILTVAMVAMLLPAKRAAGLNPLQALRYE